MEAKIKIILEMGLRGNISAYVVVIQIRVRSSAIRQGYFILALTSLQSLGAILNGYFY